MNFGDLQLGYFLFNHLTCESTIAVHAGLFKNLYDGPIFTERATGTDECPEYCLKEDVLIACPVKCECAYVREIVQVVKKFPKDAVKFH